MVKVESFGCIYCSCCGAQPDDAKHSGSVAKLRESFMRNSVKFVQKLTGNKPEPTARLREQTNLAYIHGVSKNCAFLFLSELCQISTNLSFGR